MEGLNVPAVPVAPSASVATPAATEAKGTPDLKAAAPADTKAVSKMSPADAKAELEKVSVGEGESYTRAELKALIEKAKQADEIKKGADKTFRESANMRKESVRFFKMAKENPREFLEKTGVDPKKFSYDEVARDIQDKLRDPREVELEKAQQRLKEYEAKEAEAKEKFESERLDRQSKAIEARMHAEAIAALEKHPAIPKNGFSVGKMAKYIQTVQQKTGVLLSFEDVAGVIEGDIRSEVSGTLKGATAEQLIGLIGPEGAELIRKYHLDQLKNPLSGGKGATQVGSSKPTEKKWKNSQDFWKTIDKAAKAERGE